MSSTTHALSIAEQAQQLYCGEGLAPMVRASTIPLRTLAIKYGADICYTEELIDKSLIETTRHEDNNVKHRDDGTSTTIIDYVKDTSQYSKKQKRKLENGTAMAPLLLRIDSKREQNKLICQLGTGEPETALQAAIHVHRDVSAIDVNMGCPKKFSISGGMGSALLTDPDRACRIIRTLASNLPIPVSAKIRLLSSENPQSTVDFISGLVNAGVHAVAIHGRCVGDLSTQNANWDTLRQVVIHAKSKFPLLPILINGDFYTRQEFTQFQLETGANGVLLARPALYNTSIFRKPSSNNDHQPSTPTNDAVVKYGYQSPLLLDKMAVIQDYLKEAIRYDTNPKNVKYVVCEMMNNRRTPHSRTPFLPQRYADRKRQTISNMCHCKTVREMCQIWNVNYDDQQQHSQQQQLCRPVSSDQQVVVAEEGRAGIHKYDDSYLLDTMSTSSSAVVIKEGTTPPIVKEYQSVDDSTATSLTPSKRLRVVNNNNNGSNDQTYKNDDDRCRSVRN